MRLYVKIWCTVFAAVSLAVSILGIVIAMVKQCRGIGVEMLIFGLVGFSVSVTYLLSSCCFQLACWECSGNWLIVMVADIVLSIFFFTIICTLHVLFMIFGVALICVRYSFKMLITLPPEEWNELFDKLPDSFKAGGLTTIDKLQNFVVGVGIGLIIISVLILITFIWDERFLMGPEFLFQYFLPAVAFVEMMIGIALAIFLLVLKANQNTVFFDNQITNNIIVPIVVVCFLFAFVGCIGFAGIFIGRRCVAAAIGIGNYAVGCAGKIISPIFNIGNIIILVAFLVLFVLCIVFNTHVSKWSEDLCPHHIDEAGMDTDTCQETLNNTNTNICPGEECYNVDVLKKDVKTMMHGFTFILLFVCVYLVLFLLFITIFTCVRCSGFIDDSEEDKERHAYTNFY